MKHSAILLLVLVLIASGPSCALAQERATREILWLEGPQNTSASWTRAKDAATSRGYSYNNFNKWPYENNPTGKTIPEWAEFFNSKGRTNILGIGHDAGGLVLRYMNALSPNSGLSAMILDGVPNQGAGIMEYVLPLSNSASRAQEMISRLLDLRTQAQGCNGCRMLEAIQRWLSHFSAPNNRTYYEQLKPTSPVIQNLGLPTIPYAVIWGNEDEDDALVLTRMMSSWSNSTRLGQDGDYLDCYRKELEQRIRDAKDNALVGLLQSVAGLAGAVAKIPFAEAEPGKIAEAVGAAINAVANAVRTRQNLQRELREAFECELIHQALNAEWNFMVAPYLLKEGTAAVPCLPCSHCAGMGPGLIDGCLAICSHNCEENVETYTYQYYEFEPHDGLLTRSEQLLAGAAKTYEAQKVNHFQEQFWEYTPIGNAFQDLFNGGAGAAFVVPK